mgnify:CR=1 FL=1
MLAQTMGARGYQLDVTVGKTGLELAARVREPGQPLVTLPVENLSTSEMLRIGVATGCALASITGLLFRPPATGPAPVRIPASLASVMRAALVRILTGWLLANRLPGHRLFLRLDDVTLAVQVHGSARLDFRVLTADCLPCAKHLLGEDDALMPGASRELAFRDLAIAAAVDHQPLIRSAMLQQVSFAHASTPEAFGVAQHQPIMSLEGRLVPLDSAASDAAQYLGNRGASEIPLQYLEQFARPSLVSFLALLPQLVLHRALSGDVFSIATV